MNRLNRYARDGSILSILPNPFTRVDLGPPPPRPDAPKPAPPASPRPAGPPVRS